MRGLNDLYKNIQKKFETFSQSRHFKYGIPTFAIVAFSAFFIRTFQTVRYEFRTVKTLTPEECERFGLREAPKLEEIYEEMKDLANEEWTNVRIPRPWEETSEN